MERGAALQALLQDLVLAGQTAPLEDHVENALQPSEVDRFLDVVGGTRLDGLNGILHGRVGRHEDQLDVGILSLDVMQELDAAHARHADVGEDEVDRRGGECLQGRIRALGGADGEVAFAQEELEDPPDVRIVLDDKHPIAVLQSHGPLD